MLAADAVAVEREPDQRVMVWIEDGTGAIARGVAVSVTAGGTRVRLSETPAFDGGDAVSLRLCFQVGAPTVAMTARVVWVRAAGSTNECGLEWTATPRQRAALDTWLAAHD